ncbi:MAG: hypothetical protein GY820_11560, partial [Gammaproteobacteria bacterium]|nr:hypothetical protein [Gammaproteobacteria bacterium]
LLNSVVLWQEREIGIRALLTSGEDWEDYQIWLMVWHYVVEFVGNSKVLYGGHWATGVPTTNV